MREIAYNDLRKFDPFREILMREITYVVYRVMDGDGIEFHFDDQVEAEAYAKKHGKKVEIRWS